MDAPVFIGDEVTAAGYRLAGLRARVTRQGAEDNQFRQALQDAELVLVTAEFARGVSAELLARALAGPRPLVLLVTDARDHLAPPDLASRLKRQVGVAE